MNSPAKLTDTQLAILFAASLRKDRCLIAPQTLKAAAAQRIAVKLLSVGLVREIKAKTGKEAWRRDEETGQGYASKLTRRGTEGHRGRRALFAIHTHHGRFAEHERRIVERE